MLCCLLRAQFGDFKKIRQCRVCQRIGARVGHSTGHVADGVVQHAVLFVNGFFVGCFVDCFDAATLVYRNIDNHRTTLHRFDHVF